MELKFKARINDIKNYGNYSWFTNLNKLVINEVYFVRSIHMQLRECVLSLYNDETEEEEIVSVNTDDVDYTLFQKINDEWVEVAI